MRTRKRRRDRPGALPVPRNRRVRPHRGSGCAAGAVQAPTGVSRYEGAPTPPRGSRFGGCGGPGTGEGIGRLHVWGVRGSQDGSGAVGLQVWGVQRSWDGSGAQGCPGLRGPGVLRLARGVRVWGARGSGSFGFGGFGDPGTARGIFLRGWGGSEPGMQRGPSWARTCRDREKPWDRAGRASGAGTGLCLFLTYFHINMSIPVGLIY